VLYPLVISTLQKTAVIFKVVYIALTLTQNCGNTMGISLQCKSAGR